MGMYTELIIKCDISNNVPPKVVEILDALFNFEKKAIDPEAIQDLPEHPFFKTHRWTAIGSCSSYYHFPKALSSFMGGAFGGYLFSRSDLKNYDEEIEKFLDWISPYVMEGEGKCVGWKWYEEDDEPTLLIFNGNKILEKKDEPKNS